MVRALLALVLTFGFASVAGDLTPEKAAQVQRDRQKAIEEVAKKYGNKKSSELSSDERRQLIRDQNEAVAKVYEQAGVDAKEFARFEATQNREERAATVERASALEKKEADAKKAAPTKTEENGVIIERNVGDKDFDDAPPPPPQGKKKKGKAR